MVEIGAFIKLDLVKFSLGPNAKENVDRFGEFGGNVRDSVGVERGIVELASANFAPVTRLLIWTPWTELAHKGLAQSPEPLGPILSPGTALSR